MPTTYSNVSSASDLSADIGAIDVASQASGGAGTNYVITLAVGQTLTEAADIDAVNLAGNDTLTINGQGAVLNGGGAYRGLFVYAGNVTIENLTIENAVARGSGGASALSGGGAGLGGGLFVAGANPGLSTGGRVTLDNVGFNSDAAIGGTPGNSPAGAGFGLVGPGFGAIGSAGAAGQNGSETFSGGRVIITPVGPGGAGGTGGPGGTGGVGGVGGNAFSGAGAAGGVGGAGSFGGDGGSGGVGGVGGQGELGGPGGRGGAGGVGGFGGGGGVGGAGGTGNGDPTEGAGNGGNGGFGGGGAGISPLLAPENSTNGLGGFGAGYGNVSGGGGGLGGGGDIFVQQGGALTIEGGALAAGVVTAGAAQGLGEPGQAFGNGIFLQGHQSVTFGAGAETTQIDGIIADQTGSGGTGANAGAGSVVIAGVGTVILGAANTYTGGTTIQGGTLELLSPTGAGSGPVDFAGGAQANLRLDSGALSSSGGNANPIAGFSLGDTIDLPSIGFTATEEAVFHASVGGGTLKIIDTAAAVPLQATLAFAGSLSGVEVTLKSDGGSGLSIGLAVAPPVDADPGDIVVSNLIGQPYSAYEEVFTDGLFNGVEDFFTNVVGQAYSAYEYDYSAGNDFLGSKFFYTKVSGQAYAGDEYDYDGGGRLARVDFTGVSGAPYSSYEYDYVGGVYAGAKFEFTKVPDGATYSSYETDYNFANAFAGDKFLFTGVTDQPYTDEEEDFDANGKLSRVLLTGVAGQAYSSLEEDYSAGTYTRYKAYYTGITGQSYTGEEVDVFSAGKLEKVVYTGMSSTPYSSVEQDYSGGAIADTIYDFTKVTGASYYAYQVEESAGGALIQTTYDLNNGGHAIVGAENGLTIASLGDDGMTGGGSGETFVFNLVFGADKISDFAAHDSGAGHDTISLSMADFANFATVLADAAASGTGGANMTITSTATHDALTLNGVTTAQLAGLSGDFAFHG